MLFFINLKAFLLRGLAKKKPVDFQLIDAKSVLFLRYDRIGDMVITTPVFRELKRSIPNINIIVLASSINRDVILNNPFIDEVIINNKNNFFGDFISLLKLRIRKLDVCIELDHSVVPHAILRLRIINPKKIISVAKNGRYGVHGNELSMYDYYTSKPDNTHFRDIWLLTLQPFGISPISSKYDLFPSNLQKQIASDFLKQYDKKFKIGINIEGAVKGKKIKDVELEEICKGLKKVNINIQIILLASPEKLKNVNQLVEKMCLSYVSSTYKTSKILDVAALIQNLDIIITPDTSISHIASALNKPVITVHEKNQNSFQLFAPTSSISKTFFSKEKNSLEGYDVQALIDYSSLLIKKLSNENNRN
tara:strand:+ start:464 stop:1555 length:1092 start_codon:yes stop_codon:yes gene_type:complete